MQPQKILPVNYIIDLSPHLQQSLCSSVNKVTDMFLSGGDWCSVSEWAISSWVLTSYQVPSLSVGSFLFLAANEKPVFDMSLSLPAGTYIAGIIQRRVCVCVCDCVRDTQENWQVEEERGATQQEDKKEQEEEESTSSRKHRKTLARSPCSNVRPQVIYSHSN